MFDRFLTESSDAAHIAGDKVAKLPAERTTPTALIVTTESLVE